MTTPRETLLEAVDTKRRIRQHGGILAGVVVLLVARLVVDVNLVLGLAAIAAGFGLFAYAARIKQHWEVSYKGHRIQFENNPLRGEKLFIDGDLVGKGRIGYRSEIHATIAHGDGAGDKIVVLTVAGLLSFGCRILVAAAAGSPGARLSDEQLLLEVRRRGLPL